MDANPERSPSLPPQPLADVAYGLIACGLGSLGYVVAQVHAAFEDIASTPFVKSLVGWLAKQPLIETPGAPDIALGEGGARAAAVLAFLLFAWIGSPPAALGRQSPESALL